MSDGIQIAVALMGMMSSASGFERYQLQGKTGWAICDAVLLIAATTWLAGILDRVLL